MVICLEWGADLHAAQLMPLPLTVSCFIKIQIGFTFWYRLIWVVLDKGPLNGCVCVFVCVYFICMPSMLWRCWLGGRKGIRPVKTEWRGACVVICRERVADLHIAQLMPLPLTVSCFSKIQIGFTFLVPAYLVSPGQRAVKRVCILSLRTWNFVQWCWKCIVLVIILLSVARFTLQFFTVDRGMHVLCWHEVILSTHLFDAFYALLYT